MEKWVVRKDTRFHKEKPLEDIMEPDIILNIKTVSKKVK